MDPHTATSKAVANKMNLGNEVPVILPTTAYYSKFSDVVLKVFNARSKPAADVVSMVERAFSFTSYLNIHRKLWRDVQYPECSNKVCNSCIYYLLLLFYNL